MARKTIDAGDLDKRVTIQEPIESHLHGEVRITWKDGLTVWAKIEPLTGRDYDLAAQVKSEITHRVTIRFRTGITSKHCLKYGKRILQLLGPPKNIDEQNEWLVMDCAEQS